MSAGQGLVAFARGIHDQLDYAIKFFVVRESFDAERRLYDTDVLGALLPQVCIPMLLCCYLALHSTQVRSCESLECRLKLNTILKGQIVSSWTAEVHHYHLSWSWRRVKA